MCVFCCWWCCYVSSGILYFFRKSVSLVRLISLQPEELIERFMATESLSFLLSECVFIFPLLGRGRLSEVWFMYNILRPFEVMQIVLVAVNLPELKPCLLCGGQQPRLFSLSWLLAVRPFSTHVFTVLPGIWDSWHADWGLPSCGSSVMHLLSFSSHCGHLVCPLILQPTLCCFLSAFQVSSGPNSKREQEAHSVLFSSSRCRLPSSSCLFLFAL